MIEPDYDTDADYETRITYNEDLKVDKIMYLYEGILEGKVECFYDDKGRDTAWYEYNWIGGEWELDGKVSFSYQDLGAGQNIISERWYWGETERHYTDNYFEEGKLMRVLDKWLIRENGEWVTQDEDTIKFNYNQEGQISSVIDESGYSHWKDEFKFSSDTLTVNEYYRYIGDANPDTIAWSLDYKSVYLVDPDISKNQFQNIPAVLMDGDIMWTHYWHSFFDYGKILENIEYYSGERQRN